MYDSEIKNLDVKFEEFYTQTKCFEYAKENNFQNFLTPIGVFNLKIDV